MFVKINPGHQVTYAGVVFTAGQRLRNIPPAVAEAWIAQGLAVAYTPPRTAENTFEKWL
ncbi:hypothetical protein [Streptomyces sp. NPDC058441]|uniref:hypothetical protein n=1 Tax=Streptomyces sp. NPDC058441 TaxID=3346502 RepID=UPI003648AAC8